MSLIVPTFHMFLDQNGKEVRASTDLSQYHNFVMCNYSTRHSALSYSKMPFEASILTPLLSLCLNFSPTVKSEIKFCLLTKAGAADRSFYAEADSDYLRFLQKGQWSAAIPTLPCFPICPLCAQRAEISPASLFSPHYSWPYSHYPPSVNSSASHHASFLRPLYLSAD